MKFKIKKIVFVSVLICIILFSICPKVFATNGNEMSISSKSGIGNTIEIVSGNTTQIKSESVADVVSYLTTQGVTVNSIVNHKGATVDLTSTALIGTGYVLNTSSGNYSVIVYGDANGDGEVDAGDMKVVIDDFLGIQQASPIAKLAVDVYQDGELNAADLKLTLDSFLGNLTGNILKTTNASTPTPTPDVSVTPTPTPTQVVTGPQIKIGNQTIILTPDNAPEYYGQVVTNYSATNSATWRLFYVDFDGKYGDAGTIYLKADQVTRTSLNTTESVNSVDALNKMKQINPDWAQNDGVADEEDEYGVLWLCDETKWIDYKNNEKADYVIGAPSLEMYIASYNQYHSKKQTSGYQQLKCKWYDKSGEYRMDSNCSKGYMYAVGANNNYVYETEENTIKVDENNMYAKNQGNYWLASPSANYIGFVCVIDSWSSLHLDNSKCKSIKSYGISPIVSLRSNFIPEVVN